MKQIKKQYPGFYGALFIYYNKKEKLSVVLIFSIIMTNTLLFSLTLSSKLSIGAIQVLITTLNVFILIKYLGQKTRQYNMRILKESYGIEINEYTKAFQHKLLRTLFIRNLVTQYPKFEDFMADYDESYHLSKPKIGKKFKTFLLLLCSFIAFLSTFLLSNEPTGKKIKYLVLVLFFILIPILLLYLQFYPIIKEVIEMRYKRNNQIMKIVAEIKGTMEKLPRKYIANKDFKTLILNSDLIDESFRPFFKLFYKKDTDIL